MLITLWLSVSFDICALSLIDISFIKVRWKILLIISILIELTIIISANQFQNTFIIWKMKQSFGHLSDRSLSHYLFMRSNILIKRKLLKKRFDCENYFNKFDFLNHFKWSLFSMIIKTLSLSLRIFSIINESSILTFNIIEYAIK